MAVGVEVEGSGVALGALVTVTFSPVAQLATRANAATAKTTALRVGAIRHPAMSPSSAVNFPRHIRLYVGIRNAVQVISISAQPSP